MAKRRNLEPEYQETPNLEIEANADLTAKTDRRRRPRVIIPLMDDGTPDISRIDPAILEALRNTAQETAPDPIDPEVVKMALNMIANVEAAILAPRFGVPSEQALPAIIPPKPLADQIGIAGSKVLAKYSGALGKYQDEIVLGALLASWQIAVLNNLRALRREKELQKPPVMTEKAED